MWNRIFSKVNGATGADGIKIFRKTLAETREPIKGVLSKKYRDGTFGTNLKTLFAPVGKVDTAAILKYNEAIDAVANTTEKASFNTSEYNLATQRLINAASGGKVSQQALYDATKQLQILDPNGDEAQNYIKKYQEAFKEGGGAASKFAASCEDLSMKMYLQDAALKNTTVSAKGYKVYCEELNAQNKKLSASSVLQSIGITAMNMAITVAIGLLLNYYQARKKLIEDAKETTLTEGEEAFKSAKTISELSAKYTQLNNITGRTASQEAELKGVVEDITAAMDGKASALGTLTAGTAKYTAALKEETQAELKNAVGKANAAAITAAGNVTDLRPSFLGSDNSVSLGYKGDEIYGITDAELAVKIRNALSSFYAERPGYEGGTEVDSSVVMPDYSDAGNVADYYYALVDATELLENAAVEDPAILDTQIYKDASVAIEAMGETVEEYTQKQAEALVSQQLLTDGFPKTVDEFMALRNNVKAVLGEDGLFGLSDVAIIDVVDKLFPNFSSEAEAVGYAVGYVAKKSFDTVLESTKSGYDALVAAQQEANSSGFLSGDTVSGILKDHSELAQYLIQTKDGYILAADAADRFSESLGAGYQDAVASAIDASRELSNYTGSDSEGAIAALESARDNAVSTRGDVLNRKRQEWRDLGLSALVVV